MPPKPKVVSEPPKQELDAPFPHVPPPQPRSRGVPGGRKAFTETPSHSFPPRDAISSDTLPRRDLHGKFHSRLPSLLCSLKPALGRCSHTTLAQELVAVPSLGTPCWDTPWPGCAQPGRDDAVPGNRSCWQRFRASSYAGRMGADLHDGSLLDTSFPQNKEI